MTRYANLKRNESIIALFIQGIPPKEIVRELKPAFPTITSVWIVYRVVRLFLVETKRQIPPNPSLENTKSTDLNS